MRRDITHLCTMVRPCIFLWFTKNNTETNKIVPKEVNKSDPFVASALRTWALSCLVYIMICPYFFYYKGMFATSLPHSLDATRHQVTRRRAAAQKLSYKQATSVSHSLFSWLPFLGLVRRVSFVSNNIIIAILNRIHKKGRMETEESVFNGFRFCCCFSMHQQ